MTLDRLCFYLQSTFTKETIEVYNYWYQNLFVVYLLSGCGIIDNTSTCLPQPLVKCLIMHDDSFVRFPFHCCNVSIHIVYRPQASWLLSAGYSYCQSAITSYVTKPSCNGIDSLSYITTLFYFIQQTFNTLSLSSTTSKTMASSVRQLVEGVNRVGL